MLRGLITTFKSARFLFSITGVGEKREKFSGQLRCLLSQAKADGAVLQTWSGKSTRTSLMLSTWSSSCSLASLYFSSYFCISTIEPNLGNVSISKPLLNSKLVCRRILWGVAKLDAYFYPGSNIKGFFVKVVVVFSFYVAFQVPNGTFPFLSPNLTHDIYVVTTLQCAGILYMKIEYSRGCCCKISIQHEASIWKGSLLQKADNSVNSGQPGNLYIQLWRSSQKACKPGRCCGLLLEILERLTVMVFNNCQNSSILKIVAQVMFPFHLDQMCQRSHVCL